MRRNERDELIRFHIISPTLNDFQMLSKQDDILTFYNPSSVRQNLNWDQSDSKIMLVNVFRDFKRGFILNFRYMNSLDFITDISLNSLTIHVIMNTQIFTSKYLLKSRWKLGVLQRHLTPHEI